MENKEYTAKNVAAAMLKTLEVANGERAKILFAERVDEGLVNKTEKENAKQIELGVGVLLDFLVDYCIKNNLKITRNVIEESDNADTSGKE